MFLYVHADVLYMRMRCWHSLTKKFDHSFWILFYGNPASRREFPVPVHQPAVLCVQGKVLIRDGKPAQVACNCKEKMGFYVSKFQICHWFQSNQMPLRVKITCVRTFFWATIWCVSTACARTRRWRPGRLTTTPTQCPASAQRLLTRRYYRSKK